MGRWVARIEANQDTFKEFMREIRDDIKKIFSRLPPAPVSASSPLRLTDFGKQIEEHLNARDWARSLAPTLSNEVAGKQPFEIDAFSKAYVHGELEEDWNVKVASCAYEFGIDRDGVLSVLRVVLRDALLSEVSEMNA